MFTIEAPTSVNISTVRVRMAISSQPFLLAYYQRSSAAIFTISDSMIRSRTGKLIRSKRTRPFVHDGLLAWKMGYTAPHAYLYHEGTKPHHIVAKSKDGHLRFRGRGGGFVFPREVTVPGIRGKKYLTRALVIYYGGARKYR